MAAPTIPRLTPRTAPLRQQRQVIPNSAMWIFVVLTAQLVCQLGLLFEILAPFRVLFRTGAFAASILALLAAFSAKRKTHHPSFWLGIFCLIIIAVEFMHPDTNTALSAIATLGLYTAVIAPMVWVPRLDLNMKVLHSVIFFMWGFHSLSAFFGLLQVYFPGDFQPALSVTVKESRWGGENLKVSLAEGETIFRPMGLTDMPGGAANAGLYAFVFGLGLFALRPKSIVGWLGLASMPMGLFCIYLSQVRVIFVLTLIVSFVFSLVLFITKRFAPAVRVSFLVPLVLIGAFFWALSMGGTATLSRFETLIAENPDKVYASNRGHFLEATFDDLLPEYPLGAGLGRWGMIHNYFGDNSIDGSFMIWVEVQLTGWLLDGGALLIMGYSLALLVAVWAVAKIGFDSSYGELSSWALLIFSYDGAILALTFNSCPFIGSAGMEFWLLNALVVGVAQQMPRRAWQA